MVNLSIEVIHLFVLVVICVVTDLKNDSNDMIPSMCYKITVYVHWNK